MRPRAAHGHVIANGDDANTVQTLSDLHYLSFGIDAHNDIHPEGLSEDLRSFDIVCFSKRYCHVDLQVYGRHNVYNALAAASAAWVMGVDGRGCRRGPCLVPRRGPPHGVQGDVTRRGRL